MTTAPEKRQLFAPNLLLLAEEVGWHLGDGSMNFYKGKGFYQLRGHLVDDKSHYDRRIAPVFDELFSIKPSLRVMQKTGVYGFQVWSDDLVKFKCSLGLPLGKKTDFSIPHFILRHTITKRAFVRGFFDTDGCLYIQNKRGKPYPRVEMGSISERLMKQLSTVLLSLGFKPTLFREDRSRQGWHDFWRIRINGLEQTMKWFHDIEPQNGKFYAKLERIKKGAWWDTGW